MNFLNTSRHVHLLLLLLGAALISPVNLLAQSNENSLNTTGEVSIPSQIAELKEQLSITILPEVPAPGENVEITIDAFGTDLNRAEFTWLVNGTKKLTGIGERVFLHKMGGIGSQNAIRVEIAPVSGPTIVRNFNFTPGEVDVIWEAKTYTPPFYKGKALFTPESDIVAVALPNLSSGGTRINPKSAVYRWRFDYRADDLKSGYGKNMFTYTGSIIKKPHVFEVESYDPRNTSVKGVGRIRVDEQAPVINLYYNDPLLGVLFNQTATVLRLSDDIPEFSISAYPYHQSITDRTQSSYRWQLDGVNIPSFNDQANVSFRSADVADVNSNLNVTTDLRSKLLQVAKNGVYIIK